MPDTAAERYGSSSSMPRKVMASIRRVYAVAYGRYEALLLLLPWTHMGAYGALLLLPLTRVPTRIRPSIPCSAQIAPRAFPV